MFSFTSFSHIQMVEVNHVTIMILSQEKKQLTSKSFKPEINLKPNPRSKVAFGFKNVRFLGMCTYLEMWFLEMHFLGMQHSYVWFIINIPENIFKILHS